MHNHHNNIICQQQSCSQSHHTGSTTTWSWPAHHHQQENINHSQSQMHHQSHHLHQQNDQGPPSVSNNVVVVESGRNDNSGHSISTIIAAGSQGGQPTSPDTNSTSPVNNSNTNPPTPGNNSNSGSGGIVPSPQYVTITGEGNSRSYASLTPVGVGRVVDGEGNLETDDGGNASYVTYVENGSADQIYAASNGQTMSYPVFVTDSPNMYTTTTAQYYPNHGATYQQEEITYLVPAGNNTTNNNNTVIENEGQQSINHATRVSPVTVQWLLENYETSEGVSLPRSTLYFHYLRHCQEQKLTPVNAASFGKLIRSVFLGLRTRRLGTRGNSKYHYYGIRLKPSSPLNHVQIQEENSSIGISAGRNNNNNAITAGPPNKRTSWTAKSENHFDQNGANGTEPMTVQIQYLGDPSRMNLDKFPELDLNSEVPEGLSQDDLLIFRSLYRDHCENILEMIVNFHLNAIESHWRAFWRNGGDNTGSHMSSQEYEKILPKPRLELLCGMKEIQSFIREADFYFYQNIVGILLPDVLRPIPSSMTQAIRNFAKSLETGLLNAMSGYSEQIIKVKVAVVNCLAQTLRRYTSLNHLAQAARAVLQNQNQITQMLSDLNRVDFHNVEEQASWVCSPCDGDIVTELELDFKATLARQQGLEEWANWLEGVVDRVLQPHLNSPKFLQMSRHFLLKWSFYSSLVIRDLTLRSATSFGSFHLLRLLYDEYMFYLVEHRVAQNTGVVPISVIGKIQQLDTKIVEKPAESVRFVAVSDETVTTNGTSSGITNGTTTSTFVESIPSVKTEALENSTSNIPASQSTDNLKGELKKIKNL